MPITPTDVPQRTVHSRPMIRGRVVDGDGKPAAGLIVGHLWQDDPVLTDDDGHFEIPPTSSPSRVRTVRAWDLIHNQAAMFSLAADEVEHAFPMNWQSDFE